MRWAVQSLSPDIHSDLESTLKTHHVTRLGLALSFLTLSALSAWAQMPATLLPPEAPSSRTVTLEEVWRRGGEDDEEILIGVVGRGVMDSQGNTYLLDRQLSQVLVIGPDGELIKTLGREGEGPGEMTRPSDIFLAEDGQIGISQGFPGKIILINGDDTPGGNIHIGEGAAEGGFFFLGEAHMRHGNLVVQGGRGSFNTETSKNNSTQFLSLVDLEGQEITRFVEHTRERDFTRPEFNEEKDFSEMNTWALGDDILYTTPVREEYVIHGYDLQGNQVVHFRREFSPRQRSDEDKDEMTSGMRMVMNGTELEIEKHVLDHDPAVMDLKVARDGRLFVNNCFNQRKLLDEGVAGRFDVLAPDGQFLEELTLSVPEFNNKQDRLVFLDGEYWLLIRHYDSARDAMNAGFAGGDEEEEADLQEAEPLEIILFKAA
jgi:hypothetical protein